MRTALAIALLAGCSQDGTGPRAYGGAKDGGPPGDVWNCEAGERRCTGDVLETCVPDGEFLAVESRNCSDEGLVCINPGECATCHPGERDCEGASVVECAEDGSGWIAIEECDLPAGQACQSGTCVDACEYARDGRSNVGCEYWAVDLDNVSIDSTLDAAAQPFGVVLSNPGIAPATVRVERDDAPWGETADVRIAQEIVVDPGAVAVLELGQREVDGTPEGRHAWQGRSSGSALTANAYRISSTRPIVAYQFNPLQNESVFSNDASLLLPTSGLDRSYVVVGWPQTVADTSDPETDMGDDYRAFVTVVGTEAATEVTVTPSAALLPLPERPELTDETGHLPVGSPFTVTLGPYEVLNLETDGFGADPTGTEVEATHPVAVFAGNEAADVPAWSTRSERSCCADHLEEQIFPISALSTRYLGIHSSSRSTAIQQAGGDVSVADEPEWFRVVATQDGETEVTTSLPAPDDRFVLDGRGAFRTLQTTRDLTIDSDQRVIVGQFTASQQALGLPDDSPGGDPDFVVLPPIAQWRPDYAFLVPSGYAFDFVEIAARPGTRPLLDGADLPDTCTTASVAGKYAVWHCPLSFPLIVPGTGRHPDEITPGTQLDGAHTIEADDDFGLVAFGFDRFVSYGYAGGADMARLE